MITTLPPTPARSVFGSVAFLADDGSGMFYFDEQTIAGFFENPREKARESSNFAAYTRLLMSNACMKCSTNCEPASK